MDGNERQDGKKRVLVFAISCCIVICGLVVAIVVAMNNRSESVDVVNPGSESEYKTFFDGWGEYIKTNDGVGLIAVTNEQLDRTSDVQEKADIYAMRAGVLYNMSDNGQYTQQILSDAYTAEELKPSGNTAYLIYYYEHEFGNDVVAEEYLKIAEERGEMIPPGRG